MTHAEAVAAMERAGLPLGGVIAATTICAAIEAGRIVVPEPEPETAPDAAEETA